MSAATAISDRDAWLEWRRAGIGSSDMPAILGVSPFGTALGVYLEKTGEVTDDAPATMQQRIGLAMEPALGRLYEEETGRVIVGTQVKVQHPAIGFLRATLDGRTADGRVVELKTCGEARAGEFGEGEDELPEHWLIQAHHQLVVTGAEAVDFAILRGGRALSFEVRTVTREPDLYEIVMDAALDFWRRVIRRDPPPPSLPADGPRLARLYGQGEGECELRWEIAELARLYEGYGDVAAAGREADRRRKELAAEIVAALGPHASGTLPDGRVVRRKLVEVGEASITRRAYSFYRLTVK